MLRRFAIALLAPAALAAQNPDPLDYGGDVIYQIVTDRFYDGDPSNNPAPPLGDPTCNNLRRYCGGDWQGIRQRILDGYLPELGVSALWISTPADNITTLLPDFGGSAAYHAYWAREFQRESAIFGTASEFDQLLATAHAHGIKVIIDFAPNHTSPVSLTDPNYGENGALWRNGTLLATYANDPMGLFLHNGNTNFSTYEDGIYRNLLGLADLDHTDPVVHGYLLESIQHWLDRGIDGIRVDAVKHMPSGWLETFVDGVYAHRPVFVFGEWFLSPAEVDPISHDFANESGMSVLDFRFAHASRAVLKDQTASMQAIDDLFTWTASDYREVHDQVTFLDNHDIDRFHQIGANPRRLELALVLLLTSRGIPTIYYGTEQYLTGNGDPGNREPMPTFDRTTVAYRLISRLSRLRRQNEALAHGSTQERWVNQDVIVFERQFGRDVALVAINRSFSQTFALPGLATDLGAGRHRDQLHGRLGAPSLFVDGSGTTQLSLPPGSAGVWIDRVRTTPPQIGRVQPMVALPGRSLTVAGAGFGKAPGRVLLNGVEATVTSWAPDAVQLTVPPLAAGRCGVVIETAAARSSPTWPDLEIRSAGQVPVRFVVDNAFTVFGENVYLVGNVPELGGWDPQKALGPMFNQVEHQYPTWYLDVSAPAGTQLEFKFVKIFNGQVIWEGGSNHLYTTPTSGPSQVQVNWQ